eukprot:4013661-Amphidinium_carterae.1
MLIFLVFWAIWVLVSFCSGELLGRWRWCNFGVPIARSDSKKKFHTLNPAIGLFLTYAQISNQVFTKIKQ